MDEEQRKYVHGLVSGLGIIETKGTQWRITPIVLSQLNSELLDYDGFDSVKRTIEVFCKDVPYEERIVATSFLMEQVALHFPYVKFPDIRDADINDSSELIDHLIEEKKRKLSVKK